MSFGDLIRLDLGWMFYPAAMFYLSALWVFCEGIRLDCGSSLGLSSERGIFLGSAEVICFRRKDVRVSLSMM